MKKLFTNINRDTLALGWNEISTAVASTVQRDGEGVPTAWRLFGFGPVSLTQDGETQSGTFLPQHADEIVAFFKKKGERIPIDCEHFLKVLSDQLGVDEAAAARLWGERAAAGSATMEPRPDGLWLTDVKFVPRARLLLGEGLYRYFSPVIRGLQKPPLRITSVALTNTPALDNLDEIAATAETAVPPTADSGPTPGKENDMLEAIKKQLGLKPEATPEEITAAIQALQDGAAGAKPDELAMAGEVRTSLGLKPGDAPGAVIGAILALKTKADADAVALSALQPRVQTLEAEKVARDRQSLIDQGVRSGKLTPALISGWADKQDVAALTAFLAAAPVIVAPGQTVRADGLPVASDVIALGAEDQAVCRQLGIPEEAMLAQKKAQAKA